MVPPHFLSMVTTGGLTVRRGGSGAERAIPIGRLPHYAVGALLLLSMTERDVDLSEALMQAGRALRRRWWAALEDWDLSPHQARALRTVCAQDHARLSEVAARLRIAPRSATEVVDSLEARGLVARRPDPADRRAVLVEATEAGRQIQQATSAARESAAGELFGRLTAQEREQLAGLLGRLVD